MLSSGQFGQWRPGPLSFADDSSPIAPKSAKPKRKRPKFIRKVTCQVCSDVANDHIHYGAIACYSCRAFFRRGVNANAPYYCSQSKNCIITKHTRKHCQFCRFQKCLNVGMKGSWVMTEEDKREKKEKAMLKKLQKMKKDDIRFSSPTMMSGGSHEDLSDPFPSSSSSSSASFSRPHHPHPFMPSYSPSSSHYSHSHPMIKEEEFSPRSFSPPPSPSPSSSSSMQIDGQEYRERAYSTVSSHSDYDRDQDNDRDHDAYSSDAISCSSPLASPATPPKPDISFFLESSAYSTPLNQPVMIFTAEEKQLVQNVINTEMDTTRSIPVNPEVLMGFIQAARTGAVIPYNILLEGYTTCMKRIIKFASKLDFFQSFCHEDQRNLLLANTDMIVNIRSARLLRPDNNLQIQLQHCVGGESDCTAVEPFKTPERVAYQQVYQSPWACDEKHERQFASLMENLFHLEMDKTTTMLMSMIVLFSSNNAELKDQKRCAQNQEFFTHMLYRYLCCTVGKVNATTILPKYLYLISQLEEMAQIMITKRLML